MTDNQPPQPDVLTWQQHMEALIIGAVRGMAEAHAALETATAESRFMRQATSPIGTWLHSHPSIAYTGKPVGWKIESVCGTVCASPVSQKPVDGIIVRR